MDPIKDIQSNLYCENDLIRQLTVYLRLVDPDFQFWGPLLNL